MVEVHYHSNSYQGFQGKDNKKMVVLIPYNLKQAKMHKDHVFLNISKRMVWAMFNRNRFKPIQPMDRLVRSNIINIQMTKFKLVHLLNSLLAKENNLKLQISQNV